MGRSEERLTERGRSMVRSVWLVGGRARQARGTASRLLGLVGLCMCAPWLAGCPALPPAVHVDGDGTGTQGTASATQATQAQATQLIATDGTASHRVASNGGDSGLAPSKGSAHGSSAAPSPVASTASSDGIGRAIRPPSKRQATDLLEALLSDPAPSSRVKVLVVDDEGCLDAMARDATLVARIPEGVRIETDPQGDAVTSETPTDDGFDAMQSFLGGYRMPAGRSFLYSRIYAEQEQVGWLAVCVMVPAILGGQDLVRELDATSLTFGLTEAGRNRVLALRPTSARLAFTVDGQVLLAVAPLAALQEQVEPTFTLFRK